MDQFNFLATFDTGNLNPLSHQIGLSLQDVTINAPLWEPEEEIVEEPAEEPIEEPAEEDETEDTASLEVIDENEDSMSELDRQVSDPIKSCNTALSINSSQWWILAFINILVLFRRR